MPHTLLARLAAASGAALLGATLLLAPLAAGAPRPHDRAQSTTMRLAAQQLWVRGPAGVHLRLNISSPLPASRLGIKVVLYSEVHTRDTFAETLGGNEPPSEVPIDSVPEGGTIPLAGILRNGKVSLRLPVTTGVASASSGGGSTTSPALGLDCSTNCSGVYPLQLVLFDTQQNVQLGSLTTYLVYVPPANGALRLRVGLVLPLGGVPAISPAGRSTLDASQLDQVQAIARRLAEAPVGTLSVDLYSQLLVALDRTPRGAAHGIVANLAIALGGSSPRQQMLGAPFVPVDPNALARENLGGELGAQLRLSTQIDSGELRHKTSAGPTVSTQDLGPAGLGLLEQFRTRQLVVPPTSLSATPPSGTTVSPYLLENDAGTPVGTVFASDAALSSRFDQPSKDPVLSAEQFLAELAVVYFEAPY
ncbi:MAG: hypothetical protein JWM85_741, partial [Acidimicrobiaceae bacterium]|nr:hypothetical protein [Acidimicrobiaceae bacterium]